MTQADAISEPTFHADHNDPEADVVLQSKDGTLFRVHSYILRTHSTYFNGLLKLPLQRRTDGTDETPFPVDAHEDDTAYFLRLASNTESEEPPNYGSFEVILRLCDEFGCLAIKERLFKCMVDGINDWSPQWELFAQASGHDQEMVARLALAHMYHDDDWEENCKEMSLGAAKQVELSYLLGYQNAKARTELEKGNLDDSCVEYWARLAYNFEPVT